MNDADIETLELEATARHIASLRRRGICTHESLTAPDGKPATCNDCGKVFPDCEAAHEERRELLD